MSSFEELDKLSTEELHDRAFKHAKHHLNAKFFWDLLQLRPRRGGPSAGELEEGERDGVPLVRSRSRTRSRTSRS